MNKQQAIDLLSTYLSPRLLALVVQAFDDAAQIAVAEAVKAAPARDDKGEPQPNWKTCNCSTCQFVRSVLKDGDQEAHS